MIVREIDFQKRGDERGGLVVIEGDLSIPFEIRRVYYIFDTAEDFARGFHAHKRLQQVIVAVCGHCEMHLDDGKSREVVKLNDPAKAIIIDTLIWREMHNFSEDCVLLCLASEHYDETDYIRDYETFAELTRELK